MGSQAVTKELFHGTPNDICEQIYKNGFDRSYCGKNGESYKVKNFVRNI